MGLNKRLIDQAGGAGSEAFEFNVVTYTGNGGTQSITGVGFQPDLVWIKERTSTSGHHIGDSVRGATKMIYSNLTNAEGTEVNTITSFDSNGFGVGNSVGVNENTQNYVAWCFKSGGAAVSNTDGTITSQVSASEGFSIVKYTGNSQSGPTVGHLLGSKPDLILIKNLSAAQDWAVYSSPTTANKYLMLNKTNAAIDYQHMFNDTEPDSSVFTLGYQSRVNQSGNQYVAYCFSSITGSQKVGSYTGTGLSGISVTTGFLPKFIMVKAYSKASAWLMMDTVRDSVNPITKFLTAEGSGAEFDAPLLGFSVNSTGFTVDNTDGTFNTNGSTYIYLAIA